MSSTKRRAAIALGVFAIAVSVALAGRAIAARLADPRPSVLGTRLGMSADEVRAHADSSGVGDWTSSVVAGDWVLERRRGDLTVRFELHEGQLVAVRAEGSGSSGLADRPELEVTPGSVLVRDVDRGRVRITLLSRVCPTHHVEAEALVQAHVRAP